MSSFQIIPEIITLNNCKEFMDYINPTESDLIITNEYIFKPYFEKHNLKAQVIFQEKYGVGEPSDDMVEAMYKDIVDNYNRVIAIGGGTVLDISKLFSLKTIHPVIDLYEGLIPVEKNKELILIPTTCGTGSEVTNISILSLNSKNTKKGLAVKELYANKAILIPELLETLPFKFFATSSIDALIHAIESSLSPKANEFTKIFGYKAIEMILKGYKEIEVNGPDARIPLLKNFLIASTYAGIAFGNAGCAAVHALSYPLGAKYHVPHGESNYAIFLGVMNKYMSINPNGEIHNLNSFIAQILNCKENEVYIQLEKLLNCILNKKRLSEYGMNQEEIEIFTESVINNQQRLLNNNYVPFDYEIISNIYKELF